MENKRMTTSLKTGVPSIGKFLSKDLFSLSKSDGEGEGCN